MNHKKLYRLYREERLIVRTRGGRKRALGTRAPMAMPAGTEPALVAGLRLRHPGRRPPLPHPVRRRRLHAGVPGAGRRHLALRRIGSRGSWTGSPSGAASPA